MRKMPKAEIRRESFYTTDPKKRAGVLERMAQNEEITNASVRQATRKFTEMSAKSQESLDSAFGLMKTYSMQVHKIGKEAQERYD